MLFSFANLVSLLQQAPTLIVEGEQATAVVVGAAQKLLADPAVVALETLFGQYFTHTTTPGAAVVTEPKAAQSGPGK